MIPESLITVSNVRRFLTSNLFFSASFTLLFLGLYNSFSTYFTYKRAKKKYDERQLEAERNNCIVMYGGGTMGGWPPYTLRCAGLDNINLLFEPVVHFIDAASVKLDIAAMIFNVNKYIEALTRARERGVRIRMITQFEKNSPVIPRLLNIAHDIKFYVPDKDIPSSLLHYKYMIRDCGSKSQCVCFGSMNFTVTGATDNFENLVFTQINAIVTNTKENYEHCLKYLYADRQKYYKKAILKHAKLL